MVYAIEKASPFSQPEVDITPIYRNPSLVCLVLRMDSA